MSARDVVGQQPDVERPVDVRSSAVTLEVGRDDLAAARHECRDDGPEHLARAEAAMEQDERLAGAVHLVVEVQAVEVDVPSGARRLGCPVGGHVGAPSVVVV